MNTTSTVVKIRPEKQFRAVRDLNHELCDTSAVLSADVLRAMALTDTLLSSFIKLISHLAFAPITSIVVDALSIFTKTRYVQTFIYVCGSENKKQSNI